MSDLKGRIALIIVFVREDHALRALMERIDDPAFDAAACALRPTRA